MKIREGIPSMKKMNGKLMLLLAVLLLAVLIVSAASATEGVLVLPEDLETIEAQAFYGIQDVNTVIVPDGVEAIGSEAFGGSDSLQIVEIPVGMLDSGAIADDALNRSPNARFVERADTNDFVWVIEDGNAVICEYEGQADILVIPSKLDGYPVTVIGENCFRQNATLEAITIPEGVTTIEAEAFMYCQKLKTVNLPESLATIGTSAFWQCGYLDGESFAITLPDHVATIGSSAFDTDFNSCTKKPRTHSIYGVPVCRLGTDTAAALMNVDLEFSIGDDLYLRYGKGTTTGGTTGVFLRSFSGDKSLLTAIDIPDGVIGICDNAFSGCTALTELALPDTLIKIGAKSFAQCGNDSTGKVYFPVPYNLAELDNGDYSSSFYGCTNIRFECSVDTPLVQQVAYEFVVPGNHDCVLRYTSFYNRADSKTYEGLLSLADYCGTNPEAVIPEGVQFIATKAFSDYYKGHTDGENTIVTSVQFPESLFGIDDYALCNCRALTSVTIPEQITYIHDSAFRGCYMLSEVNFHNGIKTIDSNAFGDCGKDVQGTFYYVLPDSISGITYSNPFRDSPAVLAANLNTDTADWIAQLGLTFTIPEKYDFRFQFKDVSGTKKLYLTKYLGSGTTVNIPAGIYAVDGSVFKDKTALTKVVIPAGTVEIGSDAFRGCTHLTNITLPESLTNIKSCAFMGSGTSYAGTYAIHLPDHLSDSMIVSGNGSSPFRDCPALLECTRDSDTAHMMSAVRNYNITFPNEHDFLYRYVQENNVYRLYLVKYRGSAASVTIPDGIYGIQPNSGSNASEWAFGNNTTLTTVVIPEGTEFIGDSAFRGCTLLTNVTFPSTLKTLKNHAFRSCGSVSGERFYYELPGGITTITVNSADWDTFNGCGAVLIAPEGSSTCTKLHETYVHYHSRVDAEAHANAHWPESYREGDPDSYRGNW